LCNLLRWREGLAVLNAANEMAQVNGLNATWFRAINNAIGFAGAIDPHAATETIVAGLAVARRLGDERWTQGLSGQLSFVGIKTGDWDKVVEDLERTLASTTDPRTRSNSVDNLVTLLGSRGEPIAEHIAELEATDALEQTAFSKILATDGRAWGHFAAGRLDEARDLWAQMIGIDPTISSLVGPYLARLAIWANDAGAADRWQQVHWDAVPHGGAAEVDHIALVASVQGLRGDLGAAARDYREAIRRYGELRLDLDQAVMAIDMVYVLGPTDPLTIDAVARARATFAANHARLYLDQLDAALAHGAHSNTRAVASGRVERKATVSAP
jgi:hypothetical protein